MKVSSTDPLIILSRIPIESVLTGRLKLPSIEYRVVTSKDRSEALEALADAISKWDKPRPRPSSYGGAPRFPSEAELKRKALKHLDYRFAKRRDAAVVVMPEGYGKSSLLIHLIARGFKIVFCTKSNAQLLQKEREITEKWAENPEMRLEIDRVLGRMPTAVRYVSKLQNLQQQLEALRIGSDVFKATTHSPKNPYSIGELSKPETTNTLADIFKDRDLAIDAKEFFNTHYEDHSPEKIDGSAVDVTLTTLAAFQAFCASEREPWWSKLGLVESVRSVTIDEANIERFSKGEYGDVVDVKVPFRIAVIIDDPDRDDLDWLRRVEPEIAKELGEQREKVSGRRIAREKPSYWEKRGFNPKVAAHLAKTRTADNDRRQTTPVHKIVMTGLEHYVERPPQATLGYGFKKGRPKPKMIITTTEMVTAHYARRTMERAGLKSTDWVDIFRTTDCDVTAISTCITRKRNHAVLLPIIEALKEEFPSENVELIADGLSCKFNLSNSKGRNDLRDCSTVIKLSWPHPHVIAKGCAHLNPDIANDELHMKPFFDHNQMVAMLLGDLANQALGRNQGFRYSGRQAILLIDPRWYPFIMRDEVLRYWLNPWSTDLPSFNKKTSKKSALAARQMSGGQSALERRLIELIHCYHSFGLSDDAMRLAEKLTARQKKLFQAWREVAITEGTGIDLAQHRRRAQVAENVRRLRERNRAAA